MVRTLLAYLAYVAAVSAALMHLMTNAPAAAAPPRNLHSNMPVVVQVSVHDHPAETALCDTTLDRVSVDSIEVATVAQRDLLLERLGCTGWRASGR